MKFRRKQYITDKGYQWRIAAKIISICLFYSLVNVILFSYLSYRDLEALRWKMHLPLDTVGEIIKPRLLLSTTVSALLTVVTLLIFIRRLLNKTAGPIYGLKTYIEKVAAGDLSKDLYLRKGDDFQETAERCNMMVSSLRNKFVIIKNGFSTVERTLEKMEYAKDRPDIVKQQYKTLMETVDSLKREVRR